MQGNVQLQGKNEAKNKGKDGAMVDKLTRSNEEKDKRPEKAVSTDNQRNSTRKQETIQGQAVLPNSNKKGETRPWKNYCKLTPPNNPWNEVYKKPRENTEKTLTLHRPDRTVTETTEETIELMLEHVPR